AAKLADYVGGAGTKVKGTVKEQIGSTIGNERLEAEGAATRIEGDDKMTKNS
ncbi:701_t:CDS:1, partial [Dentiscutata heterogama]